MIAKNHPLGINAGWSVKRAQPSEKLRNSKTLHDEGRKHRALIVANGVNAASATPFRFDTARTSSGFATQAIAQALRVPRGTPLEVTRFYEPAPDTYQRLIRFA